MSSGAASLTGLLPDFNLPLLGAQFERALLRTSPVRMAQRLTSLPTTELLKLSQADHGGLRGHVGTVHGAIPPWIASDWPSSTVRSRRRKMAGATGNAPPQFSQGG